MCWHLSYDKQAFNANNFHALSIFPLYERNQSSWFQSQPEVDWLT